MECALPTCDWHPADIAATASFTAFYAGVMWRVWFGARRK